MKQLLMTLVCSLLLTTGALYGQSCHSKSAMSGCCKKSSAAAASLVASQDPSIEVRKDVATGEVSYFRKKMCSYGGHVSYAALNFDAKSNAFVNQPPAVSSEAQLLRVSNESGQKAKMDCSKMSKAECLERMARGECTDKAKT
ncbi:MAG TPA: hypothetical protein PKM27_01460 [Saprospiraceae bacterium]|nr:hypothetical protein [Saprospiraceae bacterium]HNT19213.1 hypothetical protein [Saprospiraceae bacterium]